MAAGGVGSSVGGAAGDNGSSGGGGQYGGRTGGLFGGTVSGVGLGGAGYNSSDLARAQAFARDSGVVGTVTRNGVTYGTDRNGNIVANVSSASGSALAAALQAAVNGTSLSGNYGSGGNNGNSNGGNGGTFASGFAGLTYQDVQNRINQINQQLQNPRFTGFDKVVAQASLYALQNEAKQREQAGFTSGLVGQRAAGQQQGDNGAAAAEAARQAEAARVAEQQRQQRIQAETAQRQSLQQQLGSTDSIEATRDLVNQINGLGSEADNAAALNKSLLDSANARLSLQTEAQKNNAIGSAQSAQQAQSASAVTGPNTALYSSKISQAVGTPISLSDQQANADEAARMGGYNDTSSFGKIRSVARAALGGLGVGGPVGGLLSGAAAVYSNFISDRQNASSRALTTGSAASKAGIGDVLAGMVKGGLTGAALGPFGALAGLVAGGAMASGTAPTADDLKGVNPLNNGVTQDKSSYGPGQTLANGQRIGQGNANDYKPGSLGSVFAGGGYNPAPVNPAPSTGSGGTTSPGSSTGTGNNGIDDRNKAGQSAFSSFIDDLRKRQMNNLLYTNAGWNGTSGTSLLGRVSGSQGAIGGLSGQVISQYGGGRSLLGGAWSF
ncbi:hypothetical protein NB703_001516 [Pantoea ananatis]|uniref:Uncharacterized protein n=1 Tax=Pantoea ananas TaxID=553 RepID=A0AAJ1FVE8_PANAN|nr:hypothetical protein [Pantoea ananatis]MCW0343423.1 hypothetical protein [Pantoea ananatis]